MNSKIFLHAVIAVLAINFTCCSRVTVKKKYNNRYNLTCYYSRKKCDKKISNICGKNQAKIISQSESMERSYIILPFSFLMNKRPVTKVTIECKDK
jgi:hypothetical protein